MGAKLASPLMRTKWRKKVEERIALLSRKSFPLFAQMDESPFYPLLEELGKLKKKKGRF